MKFSTRTTYGLRAMVCLAKNYQSQESTSLAQIAKDEHISLAYLERLFVLLKKEKIIKSEKGKSGGYKLCGKPEDIDIFQIVKTLEGNIVPYHCIAKDGSVKCVAKNKCGASSVLIDVYAAITKTLRGMKLSDLV